mgnify:CR=1 FL=1
MTQSAILLQSYSIDVIILGDEAEMVLSSWYTGDICEVVDETRSPKVVIDWPTPSISGLSPS